MVLLEEAERGGSRTEHWPWGPAPNPSQSQASPAELRPRAPGEGAGEGGHGAGSRAERKRKGPAPSPRPLGVPGSVRPPQTSGHVVPVRLYRGERAGPTGRREAAGSPTRKVRIKQK